jgi:hypothetical protein
MESASDIFHTIDDWYDGARDGAATFQGAPCRYRSVYLDTPSWDPDEDRFELTPISADLLGAMVDADRLWRRWDDARRAGTLPPDAGAEETRVLPENREPYEALAARIEAELAALKPTVLARGEFDYQNGRVRWTPIAHGAWRLTNR